MTHPLQQKLRKIHLKASRLRQTRGSSSIPGTAWPVTERHCRVRATFPLWWMGNCKGVTPGEVFWFITKGDKDNGMPSWAFLPEDKRWQVVTYVEAMASGKTAAAGPTSAPAPEVSGVKVKSAPPTPPFTDFRYEKPGTTRKITVNDLPKPLCDQFGGEWSGAGGPSGECVAGGARGIQGGTVCVRTG